MSKISFVEKNDLIVKYKDASFFQKDLELFKSHFPGHSLNNDLARANSFSYARLDGQMIGYLLEKVSIDEILENREKEPEKPIEPKTIDEIKQLLIKELGLDEKDLDALSKIIPDWTTKSDDEILSAVKTLYGENKPAEGTSGEGSGEGDQVTDISKTEDTFENRLVAYKQQHGEDYTLSTVEDVAIMFQFLKLPMPDPQDESHLKLTDLIGKKISELSFFKPTNNIISVDLKLPNQPIEPISEKKIELPNSPKTQAMIAKAETIEAVNEILENERADKNRAGVLNAGAKRIEELQQPEDPSKKKD